MRLQTRSGVGPFGLREATPVIDADHGKSESGVAPTATPTRAGAAEAEKCKKVRVILPVLCVLHLQTVLHRCFTLGATHT